MKTRLWRQGSLVRVGLILLTLTSTCNFASGQVPVVLSGLVEFSTDTAGNFDNLSVWNTRGGDSAVNLWVINGTNLFGPFVNGPSDAEAGISIPLSEGENQFVLYGNRGGFLPYHGLNLFFNGNNDTPRISVFGPTQTAVDPPFPPFSANGSTSTLTLAFQPVAAANTLVFHNSGLRVELTDYRWAGPDVYSIDRVSQPVATPDGTTDLIGHFTLTVRRVSFDVQRDYSTNQNPAPVWSYGYKASINSALTLLPVSLTQVFNPGEVIHRWLKTSAGGPPSVNKNIGTVDSISDGGAAVIPPGVVWFGPGDLAAETFGAIRLTISAGQGGNYQLRSAVRTYLDGPTSGDTDFHIVKNGVEIFGQAMPGDSATGYTNTISLAPGDTLDFLSGRGQDSNSFGSGLKIAATLTSLDFPPLNEAPTANNQSVSTAQNTPVAITLTGSDPEGDPLSFTITSSPTHGSLSGTPPNVTYTPANDYTGPDSFTFKVNDGQFDSASATVSIQVNPAGAPVILSASGAYGGSTLTVIFSEAVDPATASDVFNYFITGSDGSFLGVMEGTLASDQRTLTLTLDPFSTFVVGVSYTLEACCVCDLSFECMQQQSVPISFQQVLVAAGSVWRYLDTGVDPGTAWIAASFNDSSWASGPAELGYGDGDEATVINNIVGGSNLLTAYFRHTFNVADASGISGLTMELWRDDGAIVYLNGVEVFRNNMPPGPATYSTLASALAVDDGNIALVAHLSSSALVNGANVIAVEVHQNAVTSSDISFDLSLVTGGAPINNPPVANSLSVTVQGSTPTPITLSGSDPDGDPLTFIITSSPAHGALSGVAPNVTYTAESGYVGPDSFTFKVNDGIADSGIATVSITVQAAPTSLVPVGSVWKYLDTGVDPGTVWINPSFNDSSWASGPAELGYGDGDEATVINSTVGGSRLITAYFRRMFTVQNPSSISGLSLQLWRDDGAIVYLNGVEVFRNNMPAGPASYSTLASAIAADDGNVAVTARLSSSLLVSGANLIAVEVHQNSPASSDLTFDLQLDASQAANQAPTANNQSVVTLRNTPVGITLTGSDPDGDPLTFAITSGPAHGSLSGTPPNVTYLPATNYVGPDSFTFKVNDGQLDSANATVSIQVLPPPNPPNLLAAVGCGVTVTALFDEALDPFSASDPFNYTIFGSDSSFVAVLSVSLGPDQQTVTLTLDASTPLMPGISYTLQVFAICDIFGDCLSQDSAPIQVDTTPPMVTCAVEVNRLWPPNDRFVDVGLSATASEGTLHVRIFSDEPEFADSTDAVFQDGVLRLRARRSDAGNGRVYLIVVTATDACGNVGVCCTAVVVPRNLSQASLNSVNAQAAAAQAECSPQGAPSTPYEILPGPGTFDVSRDFSPLSNPAGAWTHGYQASLGGQFVPFTFFKYSFDSAGTPVEVWAISEFTVPAVQHNATTNTVVTDGGQGVYPPGTVWYYPGPSNLDDGGVDPNDNYGVIRFTVPAGGAGIYRLQSAVRSAYTGPISGDTDFHVLHNGIELFGEFVPEEGSTGFSEDGVPLLVGDTIDFVIGRGLDNSFHGSGLIIDAVLTRVQ